MKFTRRPAPSVHFRHESGSSMGGIAIADLPRRCRKTFLATFQLRAQANSSLRPRCALRDICLRMLNILPGRVSTQRGGTENYLTRSLMESSAVGRESGDD